MRFIREEDGTLSAVIFDYVRDNVRHDEAFFAEILPALGGYCVKWNDAYNQPEHFADEGEARKHVVATYQSRGFHSNGRKYELDNY